MKQKSISILLAMLMSMVANVVMAEGTASQWDEPVKPTVPTRPAFEGTWVTPEVGKSYYIYNVGAAQFMGCGRDWGLRTITSTDSIVSPTGTQFKHATNKNAAVPYTISSIGEQGYVRFAVQNTDMSGFVTGFAEGQSWQDLDEARAAHWQLIPGDDNDFLLHDAMTDPYDADAYVEDNPATEENEQDAVKSKYGVLGIDAIENGSYTWTDAWAGSKNGKSYKVAWKFVEATDDVAKSIRAWRNETQAALDADMKVYNNLLAIYNAKLTLRTTIAAAEAASISVTDAVAIYNSETATEAEVLTANTTLQLAITLKGATLPVDITSVLQNPDFEVGNINGWETNYVSGKQVQDIGFKGASYTNGDITISRFIESWLPSPATIGDGYLQQTTYGLPAGKYRLECDAIATQQYNESAIITGAYIFTQSGILSSKTEISTRNYKPEHFTVVFNYDGGNPLNFGMKTINTSANWIAADNFKLWYDGELTESPHYTQLKDYLAQVQDQYNNEGFGNAYLCADSLTALDNAIETADNISSTDTDDECDAAYAALDKALAGVLTSIKVYQSLHDYTTLNPEGSKLAYYEETAAENGWNELSNSLHQLQDNFDMAYEDGTWSDAEVAEHINSIIPTILTWVQEHPEDLTEGNDLTMLLINADFEQGKYFGGYGADDNEVLPDKDYGSIPGWTISSGNITQLHSSVLETYHRKFDFNQTIKNMPAGVYDISVQGFVRHDGTATDETIFYAGDSETTLMLRADQWSETNIYYPERDGDPCGGANADQAIENSKGEYVYVPNGMSGFYFWKQTENIDGASMDYTNWQAGDCYYTNHIKATLNEAGDFTIGVKSLGTTDWVIWSNIRIRYLGTDVNGLYVEKNNQPIEAGESADIEIGLKNDRTNLVAFQMDLTLPEGIGIDKAGCSLSSRITDAEQELTIGKLENGAYRLTSSSLSLTPISGSLGKLITLKLTAEEGCVGGTATISNIRFSTADSERVTLDDVSFDISVKYDIIYKVDNQDYKTESIAYGADIIPQSDATREGYTFSGWSEIPETMPNHDVVVTGTFSINSYTLTYELDGEVYKSTSVVYGTAITPEEDLTKEGYTFSGWSEIPETMPANDVVVTGSFSVNSYTLTYELDGEVYKSTSVEYGTAITPEEDLIKEGYTFSGWSEIPETMPANDVVVTGSFSVNSYTLTYKVDGEDYKTAIIVYGSPLTPETEPTKEGYTFTGWSEIPETMPAKDVVITGNFYLYGDVNTDTEVDVVDVVDIARYVVGTPSAKFLEKLADLNADDTVNLGDAVVLVNHIAGDQSFVKAMYAPRHAEVSSEVLKLSKYGDNISLKLTTDKAYTAFQLDLVLPEDTDIEQLMLNPKGEQKHQLIYNKLEPGRYRVAVFSPANRTFEDYGDELLSFISESENSMSIIAERIQFFDTLGNGYMFDTVGVELETGVATLKAGTSAKTDVYDLQGRKFTQPQRGVNIIRSADGTTRKVLMK